MITVHLQKYKTSSDKKTGTDIAFINIPSFDIQGVPTKMTPNFDNAKFRFHSMDTNVTYITICRKRFYIYL